MAVKVLGQARRPLLGDAQCPTSLHCRYKSRVAVRVLGFLYHRPSSSTSYNTIRLSSFGVDPSTQTYTQASHSDPLKCHRSSLAAAAHLVKQGIATQYTNTGKALCIRLGRSGSQQKAATDGSVAKAQIPFGAQSHSLAWYRLSLSRSDPGMSVKPMAMYVRPGPTVRARDPSIPPSTPSTGYGAM